jgi:Flp pilus assembly pilin Flp
MTRFEKLRDDASGQALVEYALVLALIAVAAIFGLGLVSGAINGVFTTIGNQI